MRRIVVTPAGRQRYLEILCEHLKCAFEKGSIDEWHLWLNTHNQNDIDYMVDLEREYPWIHVIRIEQGPQCDNFTICKFFQHECDDDAVYIRLDDDIVFLDEHFFDTMFEYRLQNPQYFLVYANIINNAYISHYHQQNNLVTYPRQCGKNCMDVVGWKDPHFAEAIHRAFLKDYRDGTIQKWYASFDPIVVEDYARVSINVISWIGSSFKKFNGIVGRDEELWLSVTKPRLLKQPNVILNTAIACHFSFFTQRNHLDSTDILSQYGSIVPHSTE